jgi:hypothetical protein
MEAILLRTPCCEDDDKAGAIAIANPDVPLKLYNNGPHPRAFGPPKARIEGQRVT